MLHPQATCLAQTCSKPPTRMHMLGLEVCGVEQVGQSGVTGVGGEVCLLSCYGWTTAKYVVVAVAVKINCLLSESHLLW